ncbi:microsomal dipeptidase-like Zn-dependent dipeptidase [Sphingomonas insulae]|uniref:Membrane dipeptidase n=1 Tax=Sphingomonas insulae TaxID=424800 RepID=A0ABP3SV75_9SPHN|nr:dipeptidase [Sphingomonas insulae]NIJ31303.1 microsomal dipeptidase-like Zn-dependent dipeptidase [Sphingomonas insulae]
MRKWLVAGGVIVVLALLGFFGLAPMLVERSMNRVEPVPIRVTPEARALHRRLFIADMHADTLLWNRDLLDRSGRGQVDLPRLEDGHVALQIFSSVTKTPKHQNYDANGADTDNITLLTVAQMQPPRTWTSLLERSLWHAEKLRRSAAASEGRLRLIRGPADLDALLRARAEWTRCFDDACLTGPPVGAMLSVEGLQDLEGAIGNLDRLYAAGFRMAGMAHFFDNDVSGSMHGIAKGGLTPLGRQVIARMEAKGMIVDVAHASHAAVADILRIARRPVVSSHGGVQATCKVNRNLTDDEIRGIARTGGVIGIGYWEAAVCSTRPAAVARAIAHVRDLVGVEHVGLGSDFDGAVTTGFDASQLAGVTQALIDSGFTADEIGKVMGGNVLRLLHAGLAPAVAPRATQP